METTNPFFFTFTLLFLRTKSKHFWKSTDYVRLTHISWHFLFIEKIVWFLPPDKCNVRTNKVDNRCPLWNRVFEIPVSLTICDFTKLSRRRAHDLVMGRKQTICVFCHVTACSQACLEVWQLLPDAPVHFHTTQKGTKAPGRECNIYTNKQVFFFFFSFAAHIPHTYIHSHTWCEPTVDLKSI